MRMGESITDWKPLGKKSEGKPRKEGRQGNGGKYNSLENTGKGI